MEGAFQIQASLVLPWYGSDFYKDRDHASFFSRGFFDLGDACFLEVFLYIEMFCGVIGGSLEKWGTFLDGTLFVYSCGKSYFFFFMVLPRMP